MKPPYSTNLMYRDRYTIIMPWFEKKIERKATEINLLDQYGLLERPYPIVVTPYSPYWLRKAVGAIAVCFKREFRYDFVPYEANEDNRNPWRGRRDFHFLFTTSNTIPRYFIGAVGFRYRKYEDKSREYALAWAWFHPYERVQNHLTKAWPMFRELFTPFMIEPPISRAMQAFLYKMEPDCEKDGYIVKNGK